MPINFVLSIFGAPFFLRPTLKTYLKRGGRTLIMRGDQPASCAKSKKPVSDKTYRAGRYSFTDRPNRRQQSKRRWATGRAGRLLFIVLGGLPQFRVAREVMLDPQLRVRLLDVVVDHCAAGDGLVLVSLERGHPSQL